ncbi:MAG: hypothetical protein C0490_23715, partial [Marivirga sp.]|nr:hypothetical protein [Marivirga sp.]
HIRIPQLSKFLLPEWTDVQLSHQFPNYLFALYFVFTWSIVSFISTFRIFGITSQTQIRNRLIDLNDRIESQLNKEMGKDIGSRRTWFRLSSRYKKNYPIASIKEIESELIDILEEIDKVPRFLNKPEFVIILDELDKIGRHDNKTIQDKEKEEDPSFGNKESTIETRNRQDTVLKILANLKHFFTTAKAKFIFIAGREMYDASLADISDRNYFMGSIFNDVIYVNSFLTDETDSVPKDAKDKNNHMSYHTSVIEEYVCQYLIPKSWNAKGKSLSIKTYKEYLYNFFYRNEILNVLSLLSAPSDQNPKKDISTILDYGKVNNIKDCTVNQVYQMFYYLLKTIRRNNYHVINLSNKKVTWIEMIFKSIMIYIKLMFGGDYMNKLWADSPCSNTKHFLFDLKIIPDDFKRLLQTLQNEQEISNQADFIILHTRNFITYLTYRSGGAPKKLSYLLEQYLVSMDTQLLTIKSNN